jgi:ribosomal protein L37AE/L43A
MVHRRSRPPATVALFDDEQDVVQSATCPMCHTRASLTQSALDGGGAWRCVRCGQHWDGARLTAVAAYAAWVVDRDRGDRRRTGRSQYATQYRDLPIERLDGTP